MGPDPVEVDLSPALDAASVGSVADSLAGRADLAQLGEFAFDLGVGDHCLGFCTRGVLQVARLASQVCAGMPARCVDLNREQRRARTESVIERFQLGNVEHGSLPRAAFSPSG